MKPTNYDEISRTLIKTASEVTAQPSLGVPPGLSASSQRFVTSSCAFLIHNLLVSFVNILHHLEMCTWHSIIHKLWRFWRRGSHFCIMSQLCVVISIEPNVFYNKTFLPSKKMMLCFVRLDVLLIYFLFPCMNFIFHIKWNLIISVFNLHQSSIL